MIRISPGIHISYEYLPVYVSGPLCALLYVVLRTPLVTLGFLE